MDNRVALMIDAENVGYKYIDHIIKEISKYGKLVIARFYGDINRLADEWKKKALDYAIKPMHQFNVASGKNSADMEMALDTIEIKYQDKADIFFIVSSDSDFTPLAIRLKEAGAIVIGIGEEKKVTNAFKSACSEFKYFEYFEDEVEEVKATNKYESLKIAIQNIILENGTDNQLQLSRLGDILVNQFSDFDPRKYGSSNLTSLVTKLDFKTSTENTTTFVKYENNLTLEQVKKFIKDFLGNSKKGNIGKLKNLMDKEFENFNVKNFGFSKFSALLKNLGYEVNEQTFSVKVKK